MNRRLFLQSGLASLGFCTTHAGMANGLGLLSNISASSSAATDYKTLVCINLKGGADTLSLFVPLGNSEYQEHTKIRQNLSYAQDGLISIQGNSTSTEDMGFPSCMEPMAELYHAEKMAIVSNVGPLREPVTLEQINRNPTLLPPFMGSHNDQEIHWQTGLVAQDLATGWGGRLIEAMHTQSAAIPNNISLVGARKFLRGVSANPYSVSTDAINNLGLYVDEQSTQNTELRAIFDQLTQLSQSPFESSVTNVMNSAMNYNQTLATLLQSASPRTVEYPADSDNTMVASELERLIEQLKRAAELIEIAPLLGHHRQVLFLQLNMFDTHDNQDTVFPALIKALGTAMRSFQEDLEARGVDDRVVTFTQSEFGRTITINSTGTDHGWGGHQFVMGTPVQGGQVIGELPEFAIGSSDVYQNTFIPQFSVEQFGANLASWFGITGNEMLDIFPTYNRFDNVDFGLFRA